MARFPEQDVVCSQMTPVHLVQSKLGVNPGLSKSGGGSVKLEAIGFDNFKTEAVRLNQDHNSES